MDVNMDILAHSRRQHAHSETRPFDGGERMAGVPAPGIVPIRSYMDRRRGERREWCQQQSSEKRVDGFQMVR